MLTAFTEANKTIFLEGESLTLIELIFFFCSIYASRALSINLRNRAFIKAC